MMLFAPISVVFLLLRCTLQEEKGGPNGTTVTPPTTVVTEATTTINTSTKGVTTVPPTTAEPGYKCCDTLMTTDPPTAPLLPSEAFVITTSCICSTNNRSVCPLVVVGNEATNFTTFEQEDYGTHARNICAVQVTIKPLPGKFNKRSIEVPLTISGLDKSRSITFRFQKSDNEGRCKMDEDCWRSQEQICDKKRCSCYDDEPSFVKTEDKCFSASKYGENCKYDEQCMTNDNNTFCCDKSKRCKCKAGYWIKRGSDPICITTSKYGGSCIYNEECMSSDNNTICSTKSCKCKEGYRTRSDSDLICITGFSAKVIANTYFIYITAISSVFMFYLMM